MPLPDRCRVLLLAASLALAAPLVLADTDQSARDIQSTRTLIETSKSAAQIDRHKTPEALAKRDQARELLKQAEEAAGKGEHERVKPLLNDAKKRFFEAVRLADPAGVRNDKLKDDYERRLPSARALRDVVKGMGGAANEKTAAKADELIAEAEKLRAQGQWEGALEALNKGYVTAQVAVIDQKYGKEVLADKNFTSPEDEYNRYQLGRNNEYAQLARGMASGMAPGMQGMMKPVLEKAEGLRRSGEEAAAKKDWTVAVKSLEDSTAEFKKVLRSGGLMIP